MGLMIHSLAELPIEARRGYYMYLLDYGWDEPIIETLDANWKRLADVASKNNAVVIKGTPGVHFDDEVLSWHHINGQAADGLLPAILITTRHPQDFQLHLVKEKEQGDALLLIPLRKACKSAEDVVPLLEQLMGK